MRRRRACGAAANGAPRVCEVRGLGGRRAPLGGSWGVATAWRGTACARRVRCGIDRCSSARRIDRACGAAANAPGVGARARAVLGLRLTLRAATPQPPLGAVTVKLLSIKLYYEDS